MISCLVGSKCARIGAVVNHRLSSSKAVCASWFQAESSFLSFYVSSVRGRASRE